MESARARVGRVAVQTPLLESRDLSSALGFKLLVKAESLQTTGSFKFRGVANRILRGAETEHAKEFLTWSSGNHGAALAEVCRLVGSHATVVVPPWIPAEKAANIEARGGAVVRAPKHENIPEFSMELASKIGASVVSAYDDIDVIAGQSTAISEAIMQLKRRKDSFDADAVIVPCGSGSLAAGAALVLSETPSIRLIGAEPVNAADTKASLEVGRPIPGPSAGATICDALRNSKPGGMAFGLLKDVVSKIVLVEDREVEAAMRLIFEKFKLVTEPSGAIAIAAALNESRMLRGLVVIALITGGNIGALSFGNVLAAAAAAELAT
ncbi:threonine/serine dehydratase [Trinickia sp. EG282A]|uniref:threonine/serine dehydratase n=1 Tax=Trinickia sp. EG282A TaxID=3237013 RepID=UPI0034D1FA4C